VLALFFQGGLGYSPLRSGLAVSPFALGSAAAALVAGRLVPRLRRRLTVYGLMVATAGIAVTALVLRHSAGDEAAWVAAGPLLLAGLGGGMVVSPNMTLTLASVPVVTAGAAGGAVQTARRVGSALGTAVLAAVFYHALIHAGGCEAAISDALLCAAGFMFLALLLAATDLIRHWDDPPVPTLAPDSTYT
jgi:MFS family permease